MDEDPAYPDTKAFSQTCGGCGRSFAQLNAFTNHSSSCTRKKRLFSSTLAAAQEAFRRKRQRNLEERQKPLSLAGESDQEIQPQDQHLAATSNSSITTTSLEAMDIDSIAGDPRSLAERRVRREIHLPARFRDEQPQAQAALPPPEVVPPETSSPPMRSASPKPIGGTKVQKILKSPRNLFGLFRLFKAEAFPVHDPEVEQQHADLSEVLSDHKELLVPDAIVRPYPNKNAFLLGEWYWNDGLQKTKAGFKRLVDIICHRDFKPEDIQGVPWDTLNDQLGSMEAASDMGDTWYDEPDAGWTATPISLPVPIHRLAKNPGVQEYHFPPFHHRSIISILKEKMNNAEDFQHFHLDPYELRWQRRGDPQSTSVRVQGELYTSPAFLEAHEEIQALPRTPGYTLQRVLIGLMFASDGTHLASFGSAYLWPLYLYFGNESKYRRCKPNCNLCHHVAYFQKLPPEFKDFAEQHIGGKGPNKPFLAHCQREFLHAQWKILLDDEFMDAYENGIVIMCCDGIERCFYFRIFSYAADYPEKVLLSTIRNMGGCPCPRCLIPKACVHKVGTECDNEQRKKIARIDDKAYQEKIQEARALIYEKNWAVESAPVQRILKPQSLVPTLNAFSERFSHFPFNFFEMFLVDFMHEVELGVWRALFLHLLRILDTVVGATNILDFRFREIPTFGRDSIRRFASNASELKLGTRDYENLLQCSIPAFDGLLPEPHNSLLLELLFVFAHWHGLAKLRQHTDLSLKILESTTVALGQGLRDFQENLCSAFDTKELKREAAARERRQIKKATSAVICDHGRRCESGGTTTSIATETNTATEGQQPHTKQVHAAPANLSSQSQGHTGDTIPPVACGTTSGSAVAGKATRAKIPLGRRKKTFNLNTYKAHAFGDYVETIRRYGTTDSYSTEPSELEHRNPKSRYKCTSRKKFVKQLAAIERRQARLRRIRQKLNAGEVKMALTGTAERGPESSTCRYHIGKTQNNPVNIGLFLQGNRLDPALQGFMAKLNAHLLPRVQERLEELRNLQGKGRDPGSANLDLDGYIKQPALNSIIIKDNRMYIHKIARFYHTTYDVRRSEDVINPRTSHCDIMLLSEPQANSGPPAHPFLYARVLGIYHVNVVYSGPGMFNYEAMRFDFLWIRWFQLSTNPINAGWAASRLDCVSFPPLAQIDAFGFVDPEQVLRSCHLIPAFSGGKRHQDGIGLSKNAKDGQEWKSYYVNRFADRDMLMRHHWGLGIGHSYSHGVVPANQAAPPPGLESIIVPPNQDPGKNLDEAGDYGDKGGFDSSDSDNSEFGLDDRDDPNLDASSESCSDEEEAPCDDQSQDDDEEFLEFHDMYS